MEKSTSVWMTARALYLAETFYLSFLEGQLNNHFLQKRQMQVVAFTFPQHLYFLTRAPITIASPQQFTLHMASKQRNGILEPPYLQCSAKNHALVKFCLTQSRQLS
jgi:hypothetical protein